MNKKKITIKGLRKQLTDFQKQLLNDTWERFLSDGAWPILREFYSKHGKKKVIDALSVMPGQGNVGREERSNQGKMEYRLTLLGALMTAKGEECETLLAKLLKYQKVQFQTNWKADHYRAQDVAKALQVDREALAVLGQLIAIGGFGGGSFTPTDDWSVNTIEEVEDFIDDRFTEHLHRLLFRSYRMDLEVFEHERWRLAGATGSGPTSGLPKAQEELSNPTGTKPNYIPNTAFIMMWMDMKNAELADVHNGIKDVCMEFNIKAIRVDDLQHQDRITDLIPKKISDSEVLIADLTEARPNVYYEVGWAHAKERRPILFRKTGTELHFDLSGFNVPEYKNVTDLKEKLRARLSAILGRQPKPKGRQR